MQVNKVTDEVNNNDPLSLSTSGVVGRDGGGAAAPIIHPATTLTVVYAAEANSGSVNASENDAELPPVSPVAGFRDDPPKLTEVKLEPASPPDSPPPPSISPAVDVMTYDDDEASSPQPEMDRASPDDQLFQPINRGHGENLGYYEYDSTDRLDIECGNNKAVLFIEKLCQGSKGKCIEFMGNMLTPNEFQSVSGRETAKDWKRSIRYRGKSLKTLMARGLLKAHPLLCECHRCKTVLHKKKLEKTSPPESKRQIIDMSIDNNYVTQYSSSHGGPDAKRSRSVSPMDIYDVEQRRLFEVANSPEPKNIETFQRSLKGEESLSTREGSPGEKSPSHNGSPNETAPSTTAQTEVVLKNLHYTSITKPLGKNRKQTAPKQTVPHIALTAIPTIKTHSVMRPRLHQASQSLTISPGPAPEGTVIKRARSMITPTSKTPSHVRMIELTRPAQSSTDRRTPPTSIANGDGSSYRQSASSTSDTVFIPSEMSNWSVDDVAEFVQSLKGCEEYSQVFRDQAIDGEILPVLTEEHLLHNMGLKLGPALKIKIHVAKRLGYTILDETLQ